METAISLTARILTAHEAREQERERISADMHDEIGSGITAIRLMSELAKNKLAGRIPVELERISATAQDLLDNMHAIIWSLHSANDSLENLCCYLRTWAIEYFENTKIECSVRIATNMPTVEISGEKRRNIYLAVKEALTNILKHAFASKVEIDVSFYPVFRIQISDNGRGIKSENLRAHGNGIGNMQKRMNALKGSINIEAHKGTTVILEVPAF